MGNYGIDHASLSAKVQSDMHKIKLRETWKERHAKGVPVVMNTKEWRECLLKMPEGDLTEFCQLDISGVKYYRGAPSVTFMDKGIRATFCNFRYKPEWIEKKGGCNV